MKKHEKMKRILNISPREELIDILVCEEKIEGDSEYMEKFIQ